jgi:hypothetical protein
MKVLCLYILLVGIPAVGVVEVLRIGENLRPPIFIGGTWSIQVSSETAGGRPCGDIPILFDGATLTISQSGSNLLLTLNNEQKTTLAGEIRDLTIIASMLHSSITEGVAPDHNVVLIYLQAPADRPAERNCLQGVLKSTGCPTQADMTFVATRQPLEKQSMGD